MGFLPGFEDDVFISYAHNDNEPFGPEKNGWVALLHNELSKRIKFYLNQPPALWRDPDLKGNEVFDDKIANHLTRSAVLLTVLSDNYLERPYCQLEVQVFYKSAGKELKVGEKCRIFKVELRPVKRNKMPPEFEGTGLYSFFRPTGDRELRPEFYPEDWPRYGEQLDSLAHDIADTLRAMQQGVPYGAEIGAQAGTVYLAQSTSDQSEVRDRIRRDLQDRRITVLPPGDLPEDGDEFENKVREYLKRSDISVHIFGLRPGFKPDGRDRASTWLQHDLAMERAKDADFRRILWLPQERDAAKEEQREYLKQIQDDPKAQQGAEILWGKIEDLKEEINKTLLAIQKEREERTKAKPEVTPAMVAPTEASATTDEAQTVYLVCDERDLESPAYNELVEFLYANQCEVLKSLPAESADEARRLHEEHLQNCDACLIYYGAASEGWVTTKLCDCKKFGGKRQVPLRAKAVYVAPPVSEAKRKFRALAQVLQGGEKFAGEHLGPFLAELRKG